MDRLGRTIVAALVLVTASALGGNPALGQCESQKLLASDGMEWEQSTFGSSVSISGDLAVIGARFDDENGNNCGAAYFFGWDGAQWVEQLKVLGPSECGSYGSSVSVSNGVAVVGALTGYDDGVRSGAADVYRYDGQEWLLEQRLSPSDGEDGQEFGGNAIDGDVVVVGSNGKVYIYRHDGETWIEEAILQQPNVSVGISGDVVVVGNRSDRSALIYRFDAESWQLEQTLSPPDAQTFGVSVAVSGDLAIVGDHYDEDRGWRGGAVYAYRWDGGTWNQEQKLLASDGVEAQRFGGSVAAARDSLIVGSVGTTASENAYLFRWNGEAWIEEKKLVASDGRPGDRFGDAVAIDPDHALVGAEADENENGLFAGAVYVFDLDPPVRCPADLDGSGAVDFGDILRILTAWGPCEGDCPEDLDESGAVDFGDILAILTAWGPCD